MRRKKSKHMTKEIFPYKIATGLQKSERKNTKSICNRNARIELPGGKMADKQTGYVSMYGRELRLNGFKSRSSQRTEYGEIKFRSLNAKPPVTSERKNVSYTFSRANNDKFKEAISSYYNDSGTISPKMSMRTGKSAKRARRCYSNERSSIRTLNRNKSGPTVYTFKNNYFPIMPQTPSEESNQLLIKTKNGNIIHDVDKIAERLMANSDILKIPAMAHLKTLKKAKFPLPSLHSKSLNFSSAKPICGISKPSLLQRQQALMTHKKLQIKLSKAFKDKILQSNRNRIFTKHREREKRKEMFSEKNIRSVCDSYAEGAILPVMGRLISEKFMLRKQNLSRAKEIGKRTCWILKACGMWMVRHKKAKEIIAKKIIYRYLITYMKPKIKCIQRRRVNVIRNFLLRTMQYPNDPNKCFLRYARLIQRLKRNLKIHIRHQRFKHCITNFQWDKIEKQELKNQRFKSSFASSPSKGQSPLENGVPIKIRLFYIRNYYSFMRKKHFRDLEKWTEDCKTATKAHTTSMNKKNAVQLLAGKELVHSEPVLPNKPTLRVFIPPDILHELVKEAIFRHKYWKLIIEEKIEFSDLPVMKVITSQ
ncbi:unnamed protein product [Moneuplotes crassus]|uniref:Uncharacterized protein n=1 Tax=Euplotes crassus TaxID=5936 RepID=A0AAD1U5R2_EUPCR|nr:unnamed protein product [Moneuplotes crassus]